MVVDAATAVILNPNKSDMKLISMIVIKNSCAFMNYRLDLEVHENDGLVCVNLDGTKGQYIILVIGNKITQTNTVDVVELTSSPYIKSYPTDQVPAGNFTFNFIYAIATEQILKALVMTMPLDIIPTADTLNIWSSERLGLYATKFGSSPIANIYNQSKATYFLKMDILPGSTARIVDVCLEYLEDRSFIITDGEYTSICYRDLSMELRQRLVPTIVVDGYNDRIQYGAAYNWVVAATRPLGQP